MVKSPEPLPIEALPRDHVAHLDEPAEAAEPAAPEPREGAAAEETRPAPARSDQAASEVTGRIVRGEPSRIPATRRLSMNLPLPAYAELRRLADEGGRSMTDVVRTALGLAKIAIEETEAGNKLLVADADGRLLKEIVLPK